MKILASIGKTIKWIVGVGSLVWIVAYLAGTFDEKILPEKVEARSLQSSRSFTPGKVITIREIDVEQVPGTLAAKHEISISSRIMANVESVQVRAGDSIDEGSPLIVLDNRDLEARELQARKNLEAANAQLDEAKVEFERVSALLKENVVPQSKYDQSERAYRVAQAQVDRSAQALEEARVAQTFAVIRAPIHGRVVDRLIEPGDTALPGQSLLRIYDPKELRMEAYVRESLATKLTKGSTIRVFIDALQKEVDGKIEEIVPQADPGSRSFLVKVSVGENELLFPGMFGRLLVDAGEKQRLYVPRKALDTVGQIQYVTLLAEGKLGYRSLVKLGNNYKNDMLEVISGVSDGDEVAVWE